MGAGMKAVLFAAVALCVIGPAAAQGPGQTTLDLDNCGATIAGTVEVTGGLSELAALLGNVSAQIPTLTASGRAVTIFAPSNSAIGAFQAALSGAQPTMSQEEMRVVLAQMVRYHMLPVPMKTENMTAGQVLKTSLAGHSLKVTATSPQVKLEGGAAGSEARIGQPNIVICKSVMHIVDAVLLPAPIADIANGKLEVASPTSAAAAASAAKSPPKPTTPAKAAKTSTAKPTQATRPPTKKMAAPTKGTTTATKKTAAPTAAAVVKPGLTPAQARKSKTDASAAKATTNTTADATAADVAPAPAPGAASRGSTAGALCLMVAAVAATLMLG